jgi:serine protease AprX
VLANQSFVSGSNSTDDTYGHGDHVAGIIAGDATSSTCLGCFKSIRGIAPNATLVNLRVLDGNGSGRDSAVIAAIQEAINLKQAYNVRVINLSLGRPVFESYQQDPLCRAVEAAWRAGIVVVVAAGNYGRDNSNENQGYGTITSPGNDPYVITVGAMKTMGTTDRNDDLIATYSSKGPTLLDHVVKPDVVAPGNLIVSLLSSTSSTLYQAYPHNGVPPSYYSKGLNLGGISYFRLSGTSMATPMVSGAAALLLQQRPGLTPDQVKALLMKGSYKTFPASSAYLDPATGITYTDQYDIFTTGAGYLDIAAALGFASPPATASAISPSVRYDRSTGAVYMVDGSSVIWGSSSDWSDVAVWGNAAFSGDLLNGNSVLWGSSACWGTATNQGCSVLWGSSVVWGNQSQADAMSISMNGE